MVRDRLSAGGAIVLLLAILLLPGKWLISLFWATCFHEFCHLLAIYATGRYWGRAHFGLFGARIPLPDMGRGAELLCALAGPAGSLLLGLTWPFFPRLAFCGIGQACYNLLPLYPLDGGRALQCALLLLLPPDRAYMAEKAVAILCKSALLLLCLYVTRHTELGLIPGLLILMPVFRRNFEK